MGDCNFTYKGGKRYPRNASTAVGNTTAIGRGMSIETFLKNFGQENADLIRAANAASLFDMGDSIYSELKRNIEEINKFDLTDDEKQKAIKEQQDLAKRALELQAKAVNPYVSGPARLTTAQKTGSATDRVAEKRAEITEHMQTLREKSEKNRREQENKRIFEAAKKAIENKQLQFTINGKTYTRKSLRGKTFTVS